MAGIHPLSATCDHLGVIGGTLEDTWRVASQISLGVGSPGYGFIDGAGEIPPAPVKPKRLVRLYTRGWKEIDAQTERAFEELCAAMRTEGVDVVGKNDDARIAAFEDALERDVDGALDIVAYEMKWPFADYIARFGDRIGKRIHGLIKRAEEMTPHDYVALLNTRRAMRERGRALLEQLSADAYVTLASSGPAVKGFEFSGSRSFIVYGSWLGFPAFSLPLLDVDGLPFGVQVLGADGHDGRLCATAGWIMRAWR
jgi:Asp-tRNA(Asn)/Glu-tRNA(Gln) amidotransferase A subunit family amidase